jgi:hypothetical protein
MKDEEAGDATNMARAVTPCEGGVSSHPVLRVNVLSEPRPLARLIGTLRAV